MDSSRAYSTEPKSARPQGQLDGCIGQLEIELKRYEQLIVRLELITERLRGQTSNPSSGSVGDKGRIELVPPLTSRAAVLCDRIGGGNGKFDNLVTELDSLI